MLINSYLPITEKALKKTDRGVLRRVMNYRTTRIPDIDERNPD